jgi:maleate cis-trans isomerase
MAPQVGPAAKQLAASASLDVIVMGGAPVVLANGPDDLIAALQEGSGVPSTTNVDGIVKGLARLGISRVVVMAPYYPDHLLELTRSHLTSKGLEVVSLVSGGDIPFETHKNVRDIDTYRAAKKAFLATPGAEGLVIVGGGAPLSAVIGILETDIAAPVVANNFASLWNALDMVSVRTPIEGYGRLLTLL